MALIKRHRQGWACWLTAAGYLALAFVPGFASLPLLADQALQRVLQFALVAGMIALLGVYAIGWQQVIKLLPLTYAYANKAVTVLWGIVWGVLLFHEQVSPLKLLGALIVLAGVVLFSLAERGERGEKDEGDASGPGGGDARE